MERKELEAVLAEFRERLSRIEEKLRPQPLCYQYPEAAEQLGVGLTKLKKMVRLRQIRTSTVGDMPMISRSEIERLATPDEERPKTEAARRKAKWVPLKKDD